MKATSSLSRSVAVILSAALLLTAPGFDCYRALALGDVAIELPANFAANSWRGPASQYLKSPPASLTTSAGAGVAALVRRFQDPNLSAEFRGQAASLVMQRLSGQPVPSDPAAQREMIAQALSSVAQDYRAQTLSAARALGEGTLTSEAAQQLQESNRFGPVFLAPEDQALSHQTQSLLNSGIEERPSGVQAAVGQAARQWMKNADFELPLAVSAETGSKTRAAVAAALPAGNSRETAPPAPAVNAVVPGKPSEGSWTTSALKAVPSVALVAAPVAALAFGGVAVLGLGPAAAIALAGAVVGAVSANGIVRDVIARAKLSRPAAGGAYVLGLAAGATIAGGATLLLAAASPVAAAAAVSVSALGRRLMSRPAASPMRPAVQGADAPLFTVAKQGGKYLLAIDKAQFGKPYLLSATLEKGLGEKFLYSGFSNGEFLWYFERVGDHVQIVVKNTKFRAKAGTAQERAVASSIPDSSLVKAKVVADDPVTGLVVVEMDSLFAGDLLHLNPTLDQEYQGKYGLDRDLSAVEQVKAFPKNVEIRSRLTFARAPGQDPAGDTLVPDAQNLGLTLRYSLSELPQNDYAPRKADDRVGHFTTVFQDWTDPQAKDLTVRYINRWKLEKTDPKAEISPVKDPIVYWLDDTIPEKYRDTVRQAVLTWNKAFAKIGYQDAIVVKDAPKKGEAPAPVKSSRFAGVRGAKIAAAWIAKTPMMRIAAVKAEVEALLAPQDNTPVYDPSDARFNVIKWYLAADGGGPAFGPSRSNPMTGQIYNASVSFPLIMAHGSGEMDLAEAGRADETEHAGHKHDDAEDPAHCNRSIAAAKEARRALDMAEARGPMTEADKDRFVHDYIINVIMHEVGHTLGLRHNFRASGWKTDEELGATHDGTVSASVMDYGAANVAAPGKPQGSYWQTDLGPYDYWAIEYAYAPLDGMSAQAETEALGKIASRSGERGLEYGTDEDLTGMDPLVQHWYIGKDLLSFAKNRMDTVRQMWADIQKKDPAKGEGYQDLYKKYRRGFIVYQMATDIASRYIGGIFFHRNHVGDAGGKLPYEPVSADQQRATLAFLNEYVFADAPFAVDPVFLRKLAPERQATVDNGYPGLGYMPYDRFVLTVRLTALAQMFDPSMLLRLHESRQMSARGEDVFTVQELFETLTESIWAEVIATKQKPPKGSAYAISPLRRSLQQAYLQQLIFTAYSGRALPEASASAQQNIMFLVQVLQRELKDKDSVWDYESMAHLQQSLMAIKSGMEMGPLLARRQANDDE